MGCKSSVVRADGSVSNLALEDRQRAASPSALPSELKPALSSSQTVAGPTSEETREDTSGQHELYGAGQQQRKPLRSSIPNLPGRGSADTTTTAQPQQQQTAYAQDDDPFAPPPPLLPEAAEKYDSELTLHPRSSSSSSSNGSDHTHHHNSGDDEEQRGYDRAAQRHANHRRVSSDVPAWVGNHFDPIPVPATLQRADESEETAKDGAGVHPRLPSAESRTVSKDSTATFRTSISDHEKTDSAQAAKEYQQCMEAKRRAEEVNTKRRRLEEFDPVRPVDSFNVTHRGLLGRCWDRRAPELIPVSFVHAIAKALGVDESHPTSTTTVSHLSGGDEFPPGSPIQHPSRLSRQSGTRAGSAPTWTGLGGRRVPRRSHWFSVGGISTDGLNPTRTSSPTGGVEPFYISSAASSPTVPRAAPLPIFPSGAHAILMMSSPAMRTSAMHVMLNAAASGSGGENAKPVPKRAKAAASADPPAVLLSNGSFGIQTLTLDQVRALPWETREQYFNVMLSRNPRFMGIKDHFAFKLGSGTSSDRSVKFLRKRNLEPAPGVTAVRWNRVEFFYPSLHTLVRAVSKTQGASMELRRIEAASSHSTDGSGGVTTAQGGNGSVLSLYAGAGSPRNRKGAAAAATASAPSGGAAAQAEAAQDGVVTVLPDILHRSFSQCVMGQVENRSFARGGNSNNAGGGGSANGSFLANSTTNPVGGPLQPDSVTSASRGERATESHNIARGAGTFLMGLHRSHAKDADNADAAAVANDSLAFPEDSVLALALGMPYSRLGQLAGVPAAVRQAALTNAGRLGSNFLHPTASVGLGSRKASRDTLNSATNGGSGSGSANASAAAAAAVAGAPGFSALRPDSESVLVSLNVSCFSVSINPFEWQERHYTRYPVDIDGSKRSARSTYGEGVVTDVMYGGLMVVECSSQEAEKELQALLASMVWTEERSLQGIVKDVRKHLKTVQTNLQKARTAGKPPGAVATAEEASHTWIAHRYRIIRRIGGRPMRDAVELQDIRVFFDEDEKMHEERTTLHHPEQRRRSPVATAQSPVASPTTVLPADATTREQEGDGAAKNGRLPPLGLEKPVGEEQAGSVHSNFNALDPDVSSSFSRVASAWFGLPVISAVLRAWGLHLLACPEYAQPIAMFLQKHAGLAPALQLTALGSFFHEGNTPSEDEDGAVDVDSAFFETDGPTYDDAEQGGDEAAGHHPQPAPRIPKYNRFYASLPPSPVSQPTDDHDRGVTRAAAAAQATTAGGVGSSTTTVAEEVGGGGPRKGGGLSRSRPPRKDAPTAASSPANLRGSTATLDELPNVHRSHHHTNSSRHSNRLCPHEDDDDTGSHRSLGPKSHSQETVEGDGTMHLIDSVNGKSTASAKVRGAGQKSTSTQGMPVAATSSRRSSGAPPPKGVSASPPTSRCESPLSPGRMTVPHSRRNDDRRCHPSTDSSSTSSSSSSGSSFFATTLSVDKTLHSTFVYQRNGIGSNGEGYSVSLPSQRPSRLEREATAVPLPKDGSALSRTSSREAAKHMQVPKSKDGVLSPLQRRSSPSDAATSPLPKADSPRLFIPTAPIRSVGGVGGNAQQQQDSLFEYVAMAKTVGPEDSIAAAEARRRAMRMAARAGKSPPSSSVLGSQRAPPGRRGSGMGGRTTTATTASAATNNNVVSILPSSQATTVTSPSVAETSAASSEGGKGGATMPKRKKATAKRAASDAGAPLTPSKVVAAESAVIAKRPTSAAAAAIMAAAPNTTPPMVPSAGAVDEMEAQVRPLGTPTGAHGSSALFPAVGSAATHHTTQEEAEGLWYMAMLEVKAQQQELEDLRRARRQAEDHHQRRQDDLRALNRVFLPHTHPQDLDCTLLYLKTVLMEPEDLPHGRLFLQQVDWLPMLAAVWTSPANRIRSVEVAAELTWMDIPRLGAAAGLLYHHNAPAPLEELILRSEKLLGAPRPPSSGGDGNDATDGLAETKRKKLKKKGKPADSLEMSNASLNFVTELDRAGTSFGPGCPPFFIAPEEARDTLWLLLCAVATNTATANFRVVLRGIPTPESTGTAGGYSSGSPDHEKDRSASHAFTNFFSTLRREDHHDGPLLLKPASMLLDSFVVQPTLHKEDDGGYKRVGALFKAASATGASPPPLPQVRGGGSVGTAAAPTLQNASRNSKLDEAGFLATLGGSIRVDSGWPTGTAVNTPEQRSPDASRQASSLIIVTSSPVGNPTAFPDPQDVVDASVSFSPGRHTKRSLSTLMTLRTQHGAGRGTPSPARATTAVAAVTVPTHQHHVRRRPWVVDSVEVEERPFYEVLTHRCRPIEEARAAAASFGDPSPLSSPFISHYHHPFNATHNDARFFVSEERQAQLQRAVRRSAAVANGEEFPVEMDAETAVYSSKGGLAAGGRLLHLHAPHDEGGQQQQEQQQQQSAGALTPSSPRPAPPHPLVPCPPPLLFYETSMVFGLESAEEEARVLHYEEGQLRDRAADIWEALRKSVKHYNQAQQEARHKALKGTLKSAATTSQLAPMRRITLEY